MESSSEPILDVVRGLSTIASVSILVTQAKNFYNDLFRTKCHKCHGAGTVICRHCHGTKIRRTYPVKPFRNCKPFDHPNFQYKCYHCGPYAMNDFDYDKEGTDEEAWNVMDNLKAAMANKPRPHKQKAVAGTVPCPVCLGQCQLYRHTPDFANFFRLNGTWMDQIPKERDHQPEQESDEVFARELLVGKPPKMPPIEKKMPNIRGLGGRSMDELILPYIDDSDTTASSEDEFEKKPVDDDFKP